MPMYYPGQYLTGTPSVDAPLVVLLGPDGDGAWQYVALDIIARERPKAHVVSLTHNADLAWKHHATALPPHERYQWQTSMLVKAACEQGCAGCLIIWLPYADPSRHPTDAVSRACIEQLAEHNLFTSTARISIGGNPKNRSVGKFLNELHQRFGVKLSLRESLQRTITVGIGQTVPAPV